MLTRVGNIGTALLLSFALAASSFAGILGDFEEAVAKPGNNQSSHHRDHDDGYDNDDSGGSLSWFFSGTYHACKWLVYDWWANPYDDSPVAESYCEDDGYTDTLTHKVGTAGLPYARFDYRRQYLDSDLGADDFLVEAGYKMVALYGRVTHYEDRAAHESLDIQQYYGMLRAGGSDDFFSAGAFEIGVGAGGYVIDGPDDRQSGAALTVPVMLYPSEWYGFEFRPAWVAINGKTVSDYDISVSIGQKFTHLRLGYRWLWVQHEGHWLDGPYAGLSVSF